MVVGAGIDEEALIEYGEANDEDVRRIDHAGSLIHIEAVVIH